MQHENLSLREAGNALGIEPRQVGRLCRFLKIDPRKQIIPREEVARVERGSSAEDRYVALVRQVLARRSCYQPGEG